MIEKQKRRAGEWAVRDPETGRLSDAALHFPMLATDLADTAAKRQLGLDLGLTPEQIDRLLAEED